MCGIVGIISKTGQGRNLKEIAVAMSEAISHRGPDGSGFLAVTKGNAIPCFYQHDSYRRIDLNYVPKSGILAVEGSPELVFAHRRLSILDLSDTGHQPMCSVDAKIWITFNGEIYNYLEIKEELKKAGHQFVSGSDTEVILASYREWGFDCVQRFNGMWAFCIYDSVKNLCFASRDRLGVKPFYYLNSQTIFCFASEQKAFVKSKLVKATIRPKALHNYLLNGNLENEVENFFEDVLELWPGHNLVYDLNTKELRTKRYFHLADVTNDSNDGLDEKSLIEKISVTLERAIRLRLRSDVEVGTCLSGGIDSSALAVIISEITGQPLYCFTSVFRGHEFNEEKFADIVAERINAKHKKTEPALDGFLQEVDALIYSQDVPIWDTSTYAQYKVMQLAKNNGIKVVLDGQGADELFGGYHHHFVAKWKALLSQGKFFSLLNDIRQSSKTISNPYLFFIKETLKQHYNNQQKNYSIFFNREFIEGYQVRNPTNYYADVNRQLLNDIYETRLKSFLKCEDRCGMWHGVESRTPFSDDIELMTLMFSFSGDKKIKYGVSKHLLREAAKNKLPPEIYARYDKRGFETPMQDWVRKMRPIILSEIKSAGFDFVNYQKLGETDPVNAAQNKLLFKLYVLSKWKRAFA